MNWLRKFMTGRYGGDQLSVFLIVISVLLTLLYHFTGLSLLALLSYLPLLVAIYRMFSKKTQERIKASQTHKYFKCTNCKITLRVPKGKGKILVTCPKCKTKVRKKT